MNFCAVEECGDKMRSQLLSHPSPVFFLGVPFSSESHFLGVGGVPSPTETPRRRPCHPVAAQLHNPGPCRRAAGNAAAPRGSSERYLWLWHPAGRRCAAAAATDAGDLQLPPLRIRSACTAT
eukprot:165035-Chlamydomonas_euryale.AAC.1